MGRNRVWRYWVDLNEGGGMRLSEADIAVNVVSHLPPFRPDPPFFAVSRLRPPPVHFSPEFRLLIV
jgi:hypothetical protein